MGMNIVRGEHIIFQTVMALVLIELGMEVIILNNMLKQLASYMATLAPVLMNFSSFSSRTLQSPIEFRKNSNSAYLRLSF